MKDAQILVRVETPDQVVAVQEQGGGGLDLNADNLARLANNNNTSGGASVSGSVCSVNNSTASVSVAGGSVLPGFVRPAAAVLSSVSNSVGNSVVPDVSGSAGGSVHATSISSSGGGSSVVSNDTSSAEPTRPTKRSRWDS